MTTQHRVIHFTGLPSQGQETGNEANFVLIFVTLSTDGARLSI